MRTYKKVTCEKLDKIYCDRCDKLCTDEVYGNEYAVLEAMWGYASKKDGTKQEFELCEDCFDIVVDFIKSKK